MEFKNLEDIIEFALEKEHEAVAFYSKVAEQETFSGNRQLFLDFAKEEKKHVVLLEDLRDGKANPKVEDYKFVWITDIKRSNYVSELEYRQGMSYKEILTMAAKREEAALALYNECLVNADTKEAKKVFKILCQEEAKHKLALEGMLDDFMAEIGD